MSIVWRPVSTQVLASFENDAGNLSVDVFVRDDGTFGFEENRRDPEDPEGWFPLSHYSHLVFDSKEEALAGASTRVAWMSAYRG
jgi:hypothetical protein